MAIKPVVRYMLVCDGWEIREKRITINGLVSNIHSVDDPAFPL
jgi:hypothetical protein